MLLSEVSQSSFLFLRSLFGTVFFSLGWLAFWLFAGQRFLRLWQGDLERNAASPISPMMDRYTTGRGASGVNFAEYLVAPLLSAISQVTHPSHSPIPYPNSPSAATSRWDTPPTSSLGGV